MANSVAPAFVQIEYHSAYGPHVMKIPITGIENPTASAVLLTAEAWDTSSININDMVNALVTEMQPRFAATAGFDRWSVWSQPTPDDDPLFVGGASIGEIGTAGTPGWAQATQETISLRDTAGKLFKLTLMDFASGNNFAAYTLASTIGVDGIVDELIADTNAWMSRANNQPDNFIRRTATLNEALRRAYRLG